MRHNLLRTAAAVGVGALLLAACGGGSGETSSEGAGEGGDVKLTWWHNSTGEPLLGFWEDKAAEFEEANPGVTIEVISVQNEDYDTKLQVAMQSNETPSLFQQWGGGALATQVEAGKVMDLTGLVDAEVESMGGTAAGWQVDGKQYGLPMGLGVMGFWYDKDKFAEAGITETPETMDELLEATEKLKAAGITPIAVGALDKWPAGQYYYATAVRECSTEVMQEVVTTLDFSDPCWLRAGEAVQKIVDAEPFQEGFMATSAQQGAGSSAGMLANGQVAMEYMGHWNPIVMSDLTEDPDGLASRLGWFAFPQVEGGDGDAQAIVGGGDGYSCAENAPAECVDFMKFLVSEKVQSEFGAMNAGLPTVKAATDSVTDPNMKALLEYRDNATYVQLYLDQAYGPNIGGALNDAVANMFAGAGTPQDIVDAMSTAAAQG